MKITMNTTIAGVVQELKRLAVDARGEGGCHFHIDIKTTGHEPFYEVEVQSINGVNPACATDTPEEAFQFVQDQIAQLPK